MRMQVFPHLVSAIKTQGFALLCSTILILAPSGVAAQHYTEGWMELHTGSMARVQASEEFRKGKSKNKIVINSGGGESATVACVGIANGYASEQYGVRARWRGPGGAGGDTGIVTGVGGARAENYLTLTDDSYEDGEYACDVDFYVWEASLGSWSGWASKGKKLYYSAYKLHDKATGEWKRVSDCASHRCQPESKTETVDEEKWKIAQSEGLPLYLNEPGNLVRIDIVGIGWVEYCRWASLSQDINWYFCRAPF
jgi:hypothetical protein